MKFTRTLCVAVALITAATSMAELITKTLRITRSDGTVVNIDLSSGQKDGETVLPVMTFTSNSMKIELPPKVDPENPDAVIPETSYTFEVQDLKSIGTVQEEKSGIASTVADRNEITIAFTGRDLITISGGADLSAADVKLYDLQGRSLPVEVTTASQGRLDISLSPLAPGIYIIKIDTATLKVTKR